MAAVKENEAGVQVGDFFVSSWGYDQTNVDFYKVVGVTPKGVKVQKWTSAVVADYGPQVNVVPGQRAATFTDWSGPERVQREAKVEFHRVRNYGGSYGPAFTVNSYSSAHKWDGKPEYQTGAGWGR